MIAHLGGLQLLEEAHQAYLKRDEWQRRGYELEQAAYAEFGREARVNQAAAKMTKEEEMR